MRLNLDKLHVLRTASAGDMCSPGLCNLHSSAAYSSTASMNQHSLPRLYLSRLQSLQEYTT